MAKVSISKAIKLAGVSRSTFYTSYINKGRITVSSEINGKKYIETSEILRVFGKLESNSEHIHALRTEEDNKPVFLGETDMLKQQLIDAQRRELEANRRAQLQEQDFAKREEWYKKQIDALTETMKRLEGPKQPPRLWWQFWK